MYRMTLEELRGIKKTDKSESNEELEPENKTNNTKIVSQLNKVRVSMTSEELEGSYGEEHDQEGEVELQNVRLKKTS